MRLAYLTAANAFAVLRLLPMTDREKDAEILVLRHQIAVLERQLDGERVRFTVPDRALLAALLHRLRPGVLRRMRLLVRPDTVLRRHRDLIAGRHAARSKPKRPGRPPTVRSIRTLALRLVRENPGWGYRRVHGELLVLGVKVAASTVWEILKDAGVDPAPERSATTWAGFLRSQVLGPAQPLLLRTRRHGGRASRDTVDQRYGGRLGDRSATAEQTSSKHGDISDRFLDLGSGKTAGQTGARPAGFEPATVGLEVRCSVQLSYGRPASGGTPGHSVRVRVLRLHIYDGVTTGERDVAVLRGSIFGCCGSGL